MFVLILGGNRIRLIGWVAGECSEFLYSVHRVRTHGLEIAGLEKISPNWGGSAILLLEGLGKDFVKVEVTLLGDH